MNMILTLFGLIAAGIVFTSLQEPNSKPKVSLQLKPAVTGFGRNPINYSITVEDREDGSSRYNEIPGNEVFLLIKFLPDSSKLKQFLELQSGHDGIVRMMKKEICFSCHSMKQKLIGPSFEDIAKKYSGDPGSPDLMATKIIQGSKGVWSDAQIMPAHPEITKADAKTMASWLLTNGGDRNFDYVPGLDGKISTGNFPNPAPASMLVLIPSYLDHGANGQPLLEGNQLIKLRYQQ